MSHSEITFAIVEDDAGYRRAVVAQLHAKAGVRCVGEWSTAAECLAGLHGTPADVLLVDLRLGRDSGVELIRTVSARRSAPLLIALTVEDSPKYILQAIQAGAVGYLLKQARAAEIVTAMRQAVAGESPLNGVIARRLLTTLQARTSADDLRPNLSRREWETLGAMAEGLYYKEVAERLKIAEGTVRAHIYHIYRKLHVSTRAAALRKAGPWMKEMNPKRKL